MKVFLGGTCGKTDWRSDIIEMIECDYFNPVVENWDASDREIETNEKIICKTHLYVITHEIVGVYSIAEAVLSATDSHRLTIFTVLGDQFNKKLLHSLLATGELMQSLDATFIHSPTIESTAQYINTAQLLKRKTK